MPPTGEPLSPTQIELVKNWIRDGAKSPALEQAETDPRQHWAFQPPQRPDVPALDDRSGQGDIGNRVNVSSDTNPIDAFVNAELKRHGLSPRPAAPKQVLLRRVYLDLIGLPPTKLARAQHADTAQRRVFE